jgi:hypothetical protein
MPNFLTLRIFASAITPLFAADDLLLNHVGYEYSGPKTAIVRGSTGSVATTGFDVVNAAGRVVLTGEAGPLQTVPGWGNTGWKVLDFSALTDSGSFTLVAKPSCDTASFNVRRCNLLRTAGPAVVGFFKSMRNTDVGDHAIGYFGQDSRGTHDVYGGWNDATGDDGKYLSHLSYANTMNPQQIPMVVWSLLRTRLLAPATTESFKSELLAEAAWGADYLLRVQDPAGYFYINVFDHWGSGDRKICAWTGTAAAQGTMNGDYQAAWREGGGMSIAALALAARLGISGDSGSAQYLAGARRGFEHLSTKPGLWADDGRENLIDHYCALLAATELYLATNEPRYLDAAAARADSIMNRQTANFWFVSDATTRPFYHGVDEGLPLVALWAYLEADGASVRSARVRECLAKSVAFYDYITIRQVANPFAYPRMVAPIAPSNESTGSGNVALKKNAWATEVEAGYAASAAFDGIDDKGHRWSAYKQGLPADLSGYKASLGVDLGGNYNLSQIVLSWESAYATKYKIWVAGADSSQWTLLEQVDSGKGGRETHLLPEGTWARYVKLECLTRAMQYGGFSVQEMTIIGQKEVSATPVDVPYKISFFMPHRNETDYWWQGENARLGSMAAGLLLAGRGMNLGWNFGKDTLSQEVIAPLDWISGKNTANVNFVYGVGGGTYAAYNTGKNQVGGICNGITASDSSEVPTFNNDGGVLNWRWVEQWLPHDAWYLLGIATIAHSVEFPNSVGVQPIVRKEIPFRASRSGNWIELQSASTASWSLLSPAGRVIDRAVGSNVRFNPGSGIWIVQRQLPDGRRSSQRLVVP